MEKFFFSVEPDAQSQSVSSAKANAVWLSFFLSDPDLLGNPFLLHLYTEYREAVNFNSCAFPADKVLLIRRSEAKAEE